MESKIVKKLKQKNVKREDLVLLVHKGRSKGMSIGIFKNYFSTDDSNKSNKDAFWLKEGISLYPSYKHPIFGALPNIEREDKSDAFDDCLYADSKVYVGKDSIVKKLNSRKGFELYAKMLEGIL